MPSLTELYTLRDNAAKAKLTADEAEAREKAATDKLPAARSALEEAQKQATYLQTKLDKINQALAQIPVVQDDISAKETALAGIESQISALNENIALVESQIEDFRNTFPNLPVPDILLQQLDESLKRKQTLESQQQELQSAIQQARELLEKYIAESSQYAETKSALDKANKEILSLGNELLKLNESVRRASIEADHARQAAKDSEAAYEAALKRLFTDLQTNVPIALLPVRLETRFSETVNGQSELKIRIYPDDIHQDTHELELTNDEERWGKHFWRMTWRAGNAPYKDNDPAYKTRKAQELVAWQQLASRYGPNRAAYIAEKLRPTNEDSSRPSQPNSDPATPLAVEPEFKSLPQEDKKKSSWTRAAQARALPDRWLAIGYRKGQNGLVVINQQWGDLIPHTLNTGPNPTADSDSDEGKTYIATAKSNSKIPVDPEMLWMVDFDEAVKNGMGIRMMLDDASRGLDRLIVLGIKGTLNDPKDGASELQELIDAHRFTWGCSFVPQGTPTNNTETVGSGYSREDLGFQTSFALEREDRNTQGVPKDSIPDDGSQTAFALGLDIEHLSHLRYADGHDQRDAANFNRVLWPVTLGYFLDQFVLGVFPDYVQNKDKWRSYFVDYVRARGPLPTLRFGKQPYGILPVTSLNLWSSDDMNLIPPLKKVWEIWQETLNSVPHVGRDPNEIGKDLVETLGMEAISSSYSWRWVRGPRFFELFWRLPGQEVDQIDFEAATSSLKLMIWAAIQDISLPAGSDNTRLVGTTFARVPFQWNGPLVEGEPISETQTLKNNYISALANKDISVNISIDDIYYDKLIPSEQPKPLLYQLLRQATLLAYAEQTLQSWTQTQRTPKDPPWFEPELVDIDISLVEDQITFPKTPTFWRILKQIPTGTNMSLGDQLRSYGDNAPDPLGAFVKGLKLLAGLSTDSLERLLGETLDLSSHRLDAWITSLATYRLKKFRESQTTGIYLGGYGWVENLKPRTDPSLSDGYIHAPSSAQAATAAVLMSGYLTHKDQLEGARLEIDLSSKRVRLALGLMDGVRQGQPLGALLGYRLERTLHDRSLNSMIAKLRDLAPLTGGKLISRDSDEPQEAVAANNVVDGLKLLELSRQTNAFQVFSSDEKNVVMAVLNDIQDAVDAIGDLGITEGVFQAVQGNYLRAGATLDAVSRGEAPGEIQVLNTPQSGVAFTQRLVVLLNTSVTSDPSWNSERARAIAEPALNAWAEQLLGDPSKVRCKAEYYNHGKQPGEDDPDGFTNLSLELLGLCALDLIYAHPLTDISQQTELELRLTRVALQKKPEGVAEDAGLRLVFAKDESFGYDEMTFQNFFEWVRNIKELITNSRALESRDLTLAGTSGSSETDIAILNTHLKSVMQIWDDAKEQLLNALSIISDNPTSTDVETLQDVIEQFSAFAVQNAVPRFILGNVGEIHKDLTTQAQGVNSQILEIDNRLASISSSGLNGYIAKFSVLFGEGFRILLPFKLDDQASLNENYRFRPALQRRQSAGDAGSDKIITWLQTVARVREGVRRLEDVVTYSEILGRDDQMTLQVMQLPSSAEDAWNLPKGMAEKAGATSITFCIQKTLDLTKLDPTTTLVGLMVDEWVEVIPSTKVQTSLVFHYDAPGAAAPQAILLAILPDLKKKWDESTLAAILNETLDLAKLRTVDYDSLSKVGHLLPALFVAHNVGGDPHGDTISSEFAGK